MLVFAFLLELRFFSNSGVHHIDIELDSNLYESIQKYESRSRGVAYKSSGPCFKVSLDRLLLYCTLSLLSSLSFSHQQSRHLVPLSSSFFYGM